MPDIASSKQPYPTTPRDVFWWTIDRSKAFDDLTNAGARPRPYHRPGARRLPGWEPGTVANLSLGVILERQGGRSRQDAEYLEQRAHDLVDQHLPPSEHDKIEHVPAPDLHCMVAYRGLINLPAETDSAAWETLIDDITQANLETIEAIGRATARVKPFALRLQGYQVVDNSILARGVMGGADINNLTAAIRSEAKELDGNDPTISPSAKNEQGRWGMAAHVTLGVFGEEFDPRLAGYLMHVPGRGNWLDRTFHVNRLSLALHVYEDHPNARGELVGGPFEHLAIIDEFELGIGKLPETPLSSWGL